VEVEWRSPRYADPIDISPNPIYGGAYAYGKTSVTVALRRHHRSRQEPTQAARGMASIAPRQPRGYVHWERSEAIRRMVSDTSQTAGITALPRTVMRCSRV